MNEEIKNLMDKLDITEEEAKELLEYDKAVEKGKKTEYDLTPEQKKVAKSMTTQNKGSSHKKTVRNTENTEKETIITQLSEFLKENVSENCEITNKTREISFSVGENDYKVTLICKRKGKK